MRRSSALALGKLRAGIVFQAGNHHEAVRMAYPEYARLAKPLLGEFCTHEREKSVGE